MGTERSGSNKAATDRRVDVVHEVAFATAVEICSLDRIDNGSASDRDKTVKRAALGKLGSLLKGGIGRLYTDFVVNHRFDTFSTQRSNRLLKERR